MIGLRHQKFILIYNKSMNGDDSPNWRHSEELLLDIEPSNNNNNICSRNIIIICIIFFIGVIISIIGIYIFY